MLIVKNYNTSPALSVFYGEDGTDLSLMPTTQKEGEGPYDYGLTCCGSVAIILTTEETEYYMLRSTGWIKVDGIILKRILRI